MTSSLLNLALTSSSYFNISLLGMENFPVFEKCFYVAVGAGGLAVVVAAILVAAGEILVLSLVQSFNFCLCSTCLMFNVLCLICF